MNGHALSEEWLSESTALSDEKGDHDLRNQNKIYPTSTAKNNATPTAILEYTPESGLAIPNRSISQYAALLQQVPVFEPFKHGSDTVSERSGSFLPTQENASEVQERHISIGGHRRDISTGTNVSLSRRGDHNKDNKGERQVNRPSEPSAERAHSSAMTEYRGFDNRTMLLPGIRQADKKRRELLAMQLRVEDIERQLAQTRIDLAQEIRALYEVSYSDEISHEDSRRYLRMRLSIVDATFSRAEEAEEELQMQQRRVTYLHSDLNTAIESLYALMTNGAKMGDSEADMEDQMFEDAALGTRFSQKSTSLRTPRVAPDAKKGHKLSMNEHQTASSGVVGARNPHEDEQEELPYNRVGNDIENSPAFNQYRERHVAPVADQTARAQHQAYRSHNMYLRCVGKHFTMSEHDAPLPNLSSKTLLSASENIKNIRRRDLEPELSLGPELKIVQHTEAAKGAVPIPTRRGFIQKASDINVSSLHLNDLISMWSLSMSQNSWTAIHRTTQYRGLTTGNKTPLSRRSLSILESHKYSLHVIDFLRELYVHDYPKKTSILKPSSNSSIRVEPDLHRTLSPRTQSRERETTTIAIAQRAPTPERSPHLSMGNRGNEQAIKETQDETLSALPGDTLVIDRDPRRQVSDTDTKARSRAQSFTREVCDN